MNVHSNSSLKAKWAITAGLGVLIVFMYMIGCHNPYLSPQTSKAVSEEEQTSEMKKQTIQLKRIADDLDSIIKYSKK